ncbi:sensor histidine kinase [Streptomyces platensis]|uniref:sensor histidine kinase n=1 Tax=Streptomyces platensis TaxID=58346 RepID=UPI003869D1A5|nr:HAMP domain-containing histidine kinase [Streptomyces platensis]
MTADWPVLGGICLLIALSGAGVLLVTRRARSPRIGRSKSNHNALVTKTLPEQSGALGGAERRSPGHPDLLAHVARSVGERRRSGQSDMAHQLRNPMTALRLRLEKLGAFLPSAATETYQQALRDLDRMDRTLEIMLAGAQPLPTGQEPQTLEVRGEIESALNGWSIVALRCSVGLQLDGPEQVWALAQPGAVEQVLDIVVDNALKHSPTGSTIRTNLRADDAMVQIHIKDEGPGLSEAERQLALIRGWQRSPGKGGGLGLSIASGLMTASGGRLELCSHEGAGLEVVLHLPAAPAGACAKRPGTAAQPPTEENGTTSRGIRDAAGSALEYDCGGCR